MFCEQRITTHILTYVIRSDAEISSDLPADFIYSSSKPASCSLSLTSSQLSQKIKKFGSGEICVLLSTSVAEEGMDIPAANCVIRFDNVNTPVSLVQSRGRARQADSSFFVLSEAKRKPVHLLREAESFQQSVIKRLKFCSSSSRTEPLVSNSSN